jgi:hypothetical protein
MKLIWLKVTLRVVAALLVLLAVVIFVRSGLSFQSEQQVSSDTYAIHHTVILSRSAIFPAVVGVVLFAWSLFIRSKGA